MKFMVAGQIFKIYCCVVVLVVLRNDKATGDPCSPNPCENDGVCSEGENGDALCTCEEGWTGDSCDTDFDECHSEPCLNGGQCDDQRTFGSYSCACPQRYGGQNCDIERELACDSGPCENGGECIDDMDSDSGEDIYTCNCVDYTGGVTCTDSWGCLNPGIPDVSEWERYGVNYTLQFSCVDGTTLKGESNLTCISNDTWSHDPPTCEDTSPDPLIEDAGIATFLIIMTVAMAIVSVMFGYNFF